MLLKNLREILKNLTLLFVFPCAGFPSLSFTEREKKRERDKEKD